MKLNCVHVDTCIPSFWSGHHRAHVAVPVHRGMSPSSLRSAIRGEIIQGAVLGCDELSRLLASDGCDEAEGPAIARATRAAYAAIRRDVRPARKGARRLFLDLEDDGVGDGSETPHAYFVFIESDT